MISITLDFIPVIGDFKSIIEASVGYDLAGNKLSQTERTLMLLGGIAGMFTVFDEIADVARLGSKLLDNGDEVIDVLRASKGLDKIDNVADVGRSLDNVAELAEVGRGLDHIDEVADVGRNLDNLDEVAEVSRNLDNLDEATNLARTNNQLDNMDDLMGERRVFSEEETRAAFSGGSDGALSRRIEQNRLNNLSEFTNGDQALKQGDDLREALTNNRAGATLKERRLATKAWKRTGADLNDPAIRQAISNGQFPTIRGGSGALDDVNKLDWRQERWEALRKQYNIPEQAQMQSIYDIEPWEGDQDLRLWLGTGGANGRFDSIGNKMDFAPDKLIGKPYAFGGKGYNTGRTMRGAVTGEPGAVTFAQRYGYPPGKNLGGSVGENVWDELAQNSMLEKGIPLPVGRLDEEVALPLMVDYVTRRNGEIMFVLHERISALTPFTKIELESILSDPNALSRTKFIVDWYY